MLLCSVLLAIGNFLKVMNHKNSSLVEFCVEVADYIFDLLTAGRAHRAYVRYARLG